MRFPFRAASLLTLLLAAGCSNGATSSTPAVQIANIAATARLQFGVGTATIATPNGVIVGTNFVSTLRGPDGHSAVLSNTPTISGPPNFLVGFPGSPNSLSGIPPNVFDQAVLSAQQTGASLPLTFGASLGPYVGVFGYGMAADNLVSAQVTTSFGTLFRTGKACQDLENILSQFVEQSPTLPSTSGAIVPFSSQAQSQELGLPVGYGGAYIPTQLGGNCPSSLSATTNVSPPSNFPINYYGGPPAWPSAQGYGSPQFFVGYPLGFTDFTASPVLGKYSLDVAYATNASSTTYGHFDATATLQRVTPLPPLTITNAVVHPDGSGTVTLNVPPGLFEVVVIVRSFDCSGGPENNYAIVTHSAGAQAFVFAANLGTPNSAGQPTQTICTTSSNGNGGTAFAVGFDYPAYESSYPFNLTQTPAITTGDGHTGQADVTTSLPIQFVVGSS